MNGFWWWLRGLDLNQRPSGYEPDELPDCSTPRHQLFASGAGADIRRLGFPRRLGPLRAAGRRCEALRASEARLARDAKRAARALDGGLEAL